MKYDDFDPHAAISQPSFRRASYGASIFEVLHHKVAAATEKAIQACDTAVLESQQRLMEQKASLVLCELNSRTSISHAMLAAEEAQAEVEFTRTIRELPASQARLLLTSSTETERRLAVRSGYRTARSQGRGEKLLPPPSPENASGSALIEVDVSEERIAREALQAVIMISGTPLSERAGKYHTWLRELNRTLPEFAVAEIEERAKVMFQTIQIEP